MKKLEIIEFEKREDAVKMLEKVQSEFGGCFVCHYGTDELWAVSNCKGFETVAIEYDELTEIYFIDTTSIIEGSGEEIIAFIKKLKGNDNCKPLKSNSRKKLSEAELKELEARMTIDPDKHPSDRQFEELKKTQRWKDITKNNPS